MQPYEPKRRFLLAQARSGDGYGYTDVPELGMREEPECLDEDDYDRYVNPDAARVKHRKSIERDMMLLSQEERLRAAVERAQAQRRDVTREKFVLQQMLAKSAQPAKVEKRLQVLEQIAHFGRAA